MSSQRHLSQGVLSQRQLSQTEEERLNEADRLEEEVQRRVNLALCYGFANDGVNASQVLGELLKSDEDPRPRTYFIRRARDSVPLAMLMKYAFWEEGVRDALAEDVLFCVILALSQYENQALKEDYALFEQLQRIYTFHPDSGVHSAAAFCLRTIQPEYDLFSNVELQGYRADRDWYHVSFGVCMIVIRSGDYQLWHGDVMQPQIGEVQTIHVRRGFAVAAIKERIVIIGSAIARPARPVGTENMVEGKDVAVIDGFSGLGVVPNGYGVRADFSLWKNNTDLHLNPPPNWAQPPQAR